MSAEDPARHDESASASAREAMTRAVPGFADEIGTEEEIFTQALAEAVSAATAPVLPTIPGYDVRRVLGRHAYQAEHALGCVHLGCLLILLRCSL